MEIETLVPIGKEVNVNFDSFIPKITLEGLETNFIVVDHDMDDSIVLENKTGDSIELYCYNVEYVLPEDVGTDRKNIYAVRR